MAQIECVLGDITRIEVDAIVNAASADLMPQPGISSAIYAAADGELLKMLCKRIGHCRIGHAVATSSCGLSAKYIIHVAGAGWYGGKKRERMLMEQCYLNALQKGWLIGCKSIAVPLIFSGVCHMPRAESIGIAGQAIQKFEERHPEIQVLLVLYRRGIYEMALRILNK
ncbi:MAG: macro domain-containing protein [Clostridiales bacterium]|nr:macro domain-containing protein [Clostridiales bacterium]